MNSKHFSLRIKNYILDSPYYLRFFSSKILDIIGRVFSKDYIKTAIVLLIIVFFSYQFSKRIAFGHLRTVIVFLIFFLLASASINLKSGITALIIYLPFMAFIRRYIYVYGRYVPMDPILIISDVVTIWMFTYLMIFKVKEIYKLFRENKLVKFTTILLFVFILQMFNPQQGSILVGIGGAKFYIIPFLWFYFGLFVDKRFVNRNLLIIIVSIGVITALYGLKQTFFGFTPFEEYWIEWGGYSALHLAGIIRSFSTFASAGEYAHYLTFSGIICLSFFLKSRQKISYLVSLGIILTALFISAVRSAIFTFIASSIILVCFSVKDKRKVVLISLLFCLLAIMFFSKASFTSEVDRHNPLSVTSYHTIKGITNPLQESSFRTRIWLWTVGFPKLFIRNPFGFGLGASTLAAWKFGSSLRATENIFLDILLSTGLAGAVLFIIVLFYIFSYSIISLKKGHNRLFGMLVLVLTIFFLLIGNSSEYSISPIIWFLWGFIATEMRNEKS